MFEDYQKHLDILSDRTIPFLFLTGNAGTGKSTLINHFCSEVAPKKGLRVVKTAPTGIAALRINGTTLHKFFIIPVSKPYLSPMDFGFMKVKAFDVLIIDEISMVRSDVMQFIYNTLTLSHPRKLPWGGKLVRAVGDLMQLPPVVNNEDINTKKYLDNTYGGRFFFHAKCFNEIPFIKLEKVHRQSDPRFVNMLNFMRDPDPKPQHSQYLITEINKQIAPAKEESVYLCTKKAKVEELNRLKLSDIDSPSIYLYGQTIGQPINEKPASDIIELKTGCRVMLLANVDNYVNGSTGVFRGIRIDGIDPFDLVDKDKTQDFIFDEKGNLIVKGIGNHLELIVELDNGQTAYVLQYNWSKIKYKEISGQLFAESEASFTQFPITLGYALTIHKSQGLSLPSIHIDFDNGCFDHGQAYVAFSRCTSLEGITLQFPVKQNDFQFDKAVYSEKLSRIL